MASPFDMPLPRLPSCSLKRPTSTAPRGAPTAKAAKLNASDHPTSVVTLSREQLLTFTRPDLDKFVASAVPNRKLTKAERKEVSRQRKLIKNRNSAAASRQRKKTHQQQVEQSLDRLVQEQAAVRERMARLQAENQRMRDEVGFIQRMVSRHPIGQVWQRQQAKKQWEFAPRGVKMVAKLFLLFLLASHLLFSAPAMTLPSLKMAAGVQGDLSGPWEPSVAALHPALGDVEGLMSAPLLEDARGGKTEWEGPSMPEAFSTTLSEDLGQGKLVPLEELPFPVLPDVVDWDENLEKARNETCVEPNGPQLVTSSEQDMDSLEEWLEELSQSPEPEPEPFPAQFELSADFFSSMVASSVAATLPSLHQRQHPFGQS